MRGIAILALALLIGWALYSTAMNPSRTPVTTATSATPSVPRPVIRTTATQLYTDYETNEIAAKLTLGNSQIEISGAIESITENPMGHPTINFTVDGSESIVGAELNEDQRAFVARLHRSQSVTLMCARVGRYLNTPLLNGCILQP